jgi:hypothetical protein
MSRDQDAGKQQACHYLFSILKLKRKCISADGDPDKDLRKKKIGHVLLALVGTQYLVPYSRKSVTRFSPHALRGIKNKKSGGYYKIRMLK